MMADPTQPSVSIVMLNWNQCDITLDCLASLERQEYRNFKVFLADNGSADESVSKIRERFPEVELIENGKNLGYSEGNNVGIRRALAAQPDYLLLLNNDTIVDPPMLRLLIEAFKSDPKIGMAGPILYYHEKPYIIQGAGVSIQWQAGSIQHIDDGSLAAEREAALAPVPVDCMTSCALCVRTDLVKKIGLLDPSYFINFDDAQWCVQSWTAGYKVVIVPQARVWHRVSTTIGLASPASTYYMTRNALLFFWLHAPGIWKWLTPAHILARTARTIGAWTLKSKYRNQAFRRKRDANLYAVRDFALRRFGRMGPDVAKACYG